MIARTTAADAAERATPVPNQERLAALDKERTSYAAERRQLSVHDRARNNAVVERYGELARRGRPDTNAG
ncbi:hypothetical protein [Pseudonocardia sp. ICBG162]|uniref:hypothetical protein n=1 Tax=Pseudonocardia sp. ICBG162 TaxID=2846761 RepID=UPI001CF6160B|nr:hypothetical protein [Pseudonocardia sp. ICBG162]